MADLEQNVTEAVRVRISHALYGAGNDPGYSLPEVADSLIALAEAALRQSPSAAPVAVKAKALEWQKHNIDGTIWDAPAVTGGYVVRFDGKEWLTVKNIVILAKSATCEPAKAAAQADYERRILSAIETPAVQEGWKLVPDGEPVELADCPIGMFMCGNTLALRTEYGNNDGRIDAYIVSSGEFFWGSAPQTIQSQRAQIVQPLAASPPGGAK